MKTNYIAPQSTTIKFHLEDHILDFSRIGSHEEYSSSDQLSNDMDDWSEEEEW